LLIYIASDNLASNNILQVLNEQVNRGITVEIVINPNDYSLNPIIISNYYKVLKNRGVILMSNTRKSKDYLFKNNFCLIDFQTILTGTYDWSEDDNGMNLYLHKNEFETFKKLVSIFKELKTQSISITEYFKQNYIQGGTDPNSRRQWWMDLPMTWKQLLAQHLLFIESSYEDFIQYPNIMEYYFVTSIEDKLKDISDVDLQIISELKQLNISGIQISSLEPIKYLTNLEEINIKSAFINNSQHVIISNSELEILDLMGLHYDTDQELYLSKYLPPKITKDKKISFSNDQFEANDSGIASDDLPF